jgi:hypothetical protein
MRLYVIVGFLIAAAGTCPLWPYAQAFGTIPFAISLFSLEWVVTLYIARLFENKRKAD